MKSIPSEYQKVRTQNHMVNTVLEAAFSTRVPLLHAVIPGLPQRVRPLDLEVDLNAACLELAFLDEWLTTNVGFLFFETRVNHYGQDGVFMDFFFLSDKGLQVILELEPIRKAFAHRLFYVDFLIRSKSPELCRVHVGPELILKSPLGAD